MSWFELTKSVVNYGKNFFSYSIYLDEFFDKLHSFSPLMDEDDVLRIDGDLNSFFVKNIEVPIVLDLKKAYEQAKGNLKKRVLESKEDCIKRKKSKLQNELSYAQHRDDKEKIDIIQEKIHSVEPCKNHSLDLYFNECVIEPMDIYIREIRVKNF